MRNKHITRNYDANRVRIVRPTGEDFRLEIFKYDKSFEQFYTSNSNANISYGTEVKKISFDGLSVLFSRKGNLKLTFNYNAKEASSHYRLELLYANTYRTGYKKERSRDNKVVLKRLKVNGVQKVKDKTLIANDVAYNRNYQYVTLKKGNNEIEYIFSPSTAFVGLAIKKYDIWEAHLDSRNSDKITMFDNEVELSDDFSINTMKCDLMYYHGLDEKLTPTHSKANPSGLVFDYRDEINYYVKNNIGNYVRVFGGYISNINVDNDLTKVTLNCADRTIDLDRRYCLSEISVKGNTLDDKIKYNDSLDYVRNFDHYSGGIKFLLNQCEVPIKSNLLISTPLVEQKIKTLADYGKKKYHKLSPTNIGVSYSTNYVQIRNNYNVDKAQSVVIYDTSKNPVKLNNYPNLFIDYGMGKEVWEEKIYEYGVNDTGVSQSVKNKADKITKLTGNKAVKPLWEWICKHIKHNKNRTGFYQKPSTTLSKKEGNCCCKSELLLDMCNHKGVKELKYVHVKKSPKVGHVFTMINGRYVDPSNHAVGWGGYVKRYGKIGSGKTTTYPEKPF